MGVMTTADRYLNSARWHITDATNDLSELVVKGCWGEDEFNEEFRQRLKAAFRTLLDLKDALGHPNYGRGDG